jgi:hypothetical protein
MDKTGCADWERLKQALEACYSAKFESAYEKALAFSYGDIRCVGRGRAQPSRKSDHFSPILIRYLYLSNNYFNINIG